MTSLIVNPNNQNTPLNVLSHAADYLAQWKRERANSGPEHPSCNRLNHPDRDKERARDQQDDECKEFKLLPPPDTAKSSRAAVTIYSASIHSGNAPSEHKNHSHPGLHSRRATAPHLVSNSPSSMKLHPPSENGSFVFHYLVRRDHALVHAVKGHIEALHLGRRQLLAQTLSANETAILSRDCATKLVTGNVVQDLDITSDIRHGVHWQRSFLVCKIIRNGAMKWLHT